MPLSVRHGDMLTYSQWRPDGHYDYFQAQQVAPLGDDLPVPRLKPASELGVPSVEAGRPIPSGAKYVGQGEEAIGVLAPMDTSRLGYAMSDAPTSRAFWFVLGAAAGVVVAVWWRTRRPS